MSHRLDELGNNPLLTRFFLSPEEKASREAGKRIIKEFYNQQTNNDTSLNFFKQRNARWIELMLWFKGSQPMQEFLGYMSVSDANKAWLNIDMTQSRVAVQFIETLVESMAKNKSYPCVDAIDDGSLTEKEERLFDALFRMYDSETVLAMQQAAGVQMEPPNAYVPDDEMSARIYFELEDRLPKEIRFEKMLGVVSDKIKFDKVANRATLSDLIKVNAAFTKIERLAPKEYTVRKCVPTNMVYNFFMNDCGEYEITMIGEFYNEKVKDYRKKYGKSAENPNGLSEKEIFELAKLSEMKNIGKFSYTWTDNWALTNFNQQWPYDDCSILVFDTRINCGEDTYFVSKKDSFGKEDIQAKKNVPYQQRKKDGTIIEQPKPEDVEITKKKKNTWMKGVYAPYGDKLLFWGPADLIIPQYTDCYHPLCEYTVVIPNNDGQYVPSLGERILEPLREYQITKLKRKQLISQVRPAGIRIDVESARNIDLGNGDSIAWEEVLRIFNQTGTEVWSSKGLDPLSKESPAITNTAADDAIQKIIGLTSVLQGIVMEIRQLIGVPMYRDGADVGDRTSGVLQEQQESASYNVTDYILNANNLLWEETFYKLCLLHWNDIVKEEPESKEDMLNTRFKVSVKMKMTEYERQLLEKDIDRYSQVVDAYGNPALTPADAMYLREIDNYKLARWYLVKTMEKNRRRYLEETQKATQQNQQVQAQSLQEKAQADLELQKQKLAAEKELKDWEGRQKKEQIALEGVMKLLNTQLTPAATGGGGGEEGQPQAAPQRPQISPILQQFIESTLKNVGMSIFQDNQRIQEEEQAKQQEQAAMQQEAMMQQQQMQQ